MVKSTKISLYSLKKLKLFIIALALMFSSVTSLMSLSVSADAGNNYPWQNAGFPSCSGQIDTWGYCKRNCTSWVAWALHDRNSFEMPNIPNNAQNWGFWAQQAGQGHATYTVNTTPAVGAVAWWYAGELDDGYTIQSAGHVAYVGAVTGNSAFIEEYNYGGTGVYHTRTITRSSNQQVQYIHFRDGGGSSYSDGTFLALSGVGTVYRIVGGAPVKLTNQGAIPGFNGGTVTWVSQAQLNALPAYPRDGSFMNIQEAGGTGVYTFAGGAPLRLYNQGAIPGYGNAVSVNIGSLTALDHMRAHPADGTFLNIAEAGGAGIYRIVGGAPVRVDNQGAIPDFQGNAVWINSQTLATLDHMNAVPSDGTMVNLVEAGGSGVYTFAGGAPLRLYNWGPLPDFTGAININSDSVGTLDHMNPTPVNGTYLASYETGIVYRVAGGSPLKLTDWGSLPGYSGAIWVNQQTMDTLDHMSTTPSNGTILEGYPSNTYWVINNGLKISTTNQTGAVVVNDATLSTIATQ